MHRHHGYVGGKKRSSQLVVGLAFGVDDDQLALPVLFLGEREDGIE
jgi:hypothetical protein